MKRTLFIWIVTGLTVFTHSHAQIIDDSTTMVYGPFSTRYTYFDHIKHNRSLTFHPDTTLNHFHIYSYFNRNDNKIQDLGNIGTSAMPVFIEEPETIGRSSGYQSFDYYFPSLDQMKIFNTRSPYTDIYAVFAGKYRYILDVNHSQNIKPNWNFGINYKRLTINKQISSKGRGDNEVTSTMYNGYMYYWTRDSAYFVSGALSRMFHKVNESGGINNQDFESLDDFFSKNILVNLEKARSSQLRVDYQIYQQYSLLPLLTIYNDLIRTWRNNYFTDEDLEFNVGQDITESDFYENIYFNTSRTDDQGKFTALTNESGIKGDLKKAYYNAYFKVRDVNFLHKYQTIDEKRFESYLGGVLRYDNDSTYYLQVSGELMNNGNHRLSADYENRWWVLSYHRYMYEPPVIHENYFGNHQEWHNSFRSVQNDLINGALKLHFGKTHILPGIRFALVKNNIYFNTSQEPEQASGFAQLTMPSFGFSTRFGKNFCLEGEAIYTLRSGNEQARDVYRIADLFINSKFYYDKPLFDSKLFFAIGLEAHYRSSYFAKAYQPVVQQFYLQNEFSLPSYFLADVFLNLRIRIVRIFLKMTYINQEAGSGYFITPYYTGQPRSFDFGLNWMFFD